MKQILINTTTLALATRRELKALGLGAPLTRPDDTYNAPEGFAYIDDLPRPDDLEGYRTQRTAPTLDGYGWEQVEIPFVLPDPVSMAQFREELSKPAYEIDNVSLRVIVQQAVEAAGIVMLDWWDTAATVDRHNAKVSVMAEALSVSDETLDAIFIGAADN